MNAAAVTVACEREKLVHYVKWQITYGINSPGSLQSASPLQTG